MKKKLLLHVCCAPCVTVAVERLHDFQLTCWFYNPNIHPESEYRKREDELERFAAEAGIDVIAAPYDPQKWRERIAGHEDDPEGGQRCKICFEMRLKETAAAAARLGFPAFSTVLTTSPYKNARLVNEIGGKYARVYELEYLDTNFKKQDGYKKSIELSKKFDLYRQDYCGCIYSKRERKVRKKQQQKNKGTV